MDQCGSSRRLVASDPRTKATIGEMAIADRSTVSGTTVKASSETASRSPHSAAEASAYVEDVRVATFHGSRPRSVKLERALAAMEGIHGSEVDAIREALERA